MIKLIFKHSKARSRAHELFKEVSRDLMMFNRALSDASIEVLLPCPLQLQNYYGIANCSEIWFGTGKKHELVDLNAMRVPSTTTVHSKDKHFNMLVKLLCISVCEQFKTSRIKSNEDFGAAVSFYEEHVGPIPDNAAKCLGLEARK